MIYAEIVLENKTRVTDRIYTYKVSSEQEINLQIGKRVIIPFGRGNKKRLGLVINIVNEYNLKYELKYIDKIIDEKPIVEKELINLAFFMRDEYLSDFSSSFQTILPPGNWKDLEEVFFIDENCNENLIENKEIYKYLKIPRTIEEISNKFPTVNIEELKKNNAIKNQYAIKNQLNITKEIFVELSKDFDISKIRKNATAQIRIVDFLKENKKILMKDLIKYCNTSSTTVNALEEKEIIVKTEEIKYKKIISKNNCYKKIELNIEQKNVFNKILTTDKNFNLIHGVTGSGKTEIYLQLTESILNLGKTAIILVPEISLTPQTIERFSGRFPGKVAVLHSKLTEIEKLEQWQQIENGDYKIVVGARSAIFAPVKNLGLIVIDEEHDLSYFSEKNPKYNTIEIAKYRAKYNNAKLVLGSATPSIESYYNAQNGKYNLLKLNHRATESSLPDVNIIDMREELRRGNISIFSEPLKEAVEENLKNNKQSILFLNKRGHMSYIFCRRCGHVEICSYCDVAMTYHKSTNRLVCHHCGRTRMKPLICTNCGSKYIKEFGAGTEKLEEETIKLFPNAKVYRIDGDTNTSKDSYLNLYNKMKNKEIDILVGTQMITKGFDFEDVTLVGVIAADISLNIGNYKSSENTFQLLTQVAGRAGRGNEKGNVFIQTYKPDNYAIVSSKNHDFQQFYNIELEYREKFKYPPFYNLLNIKLSGKNNGFTRAKIFEIQKYIRNSFYKNNVNNIEIIGPNPSPVSRINNYFRFDINIKYRKENKSLINHIIKDILINNSYNIDLTGYKLSITPNPVSFY